MEGRLFSHFCFCWHWSPFLVQVEGSQHLKCFQSFFVLEDALDFFKKILVPAFLRHLQWNHFSSCFSPFSDSLPHSRDCLATSLYLEANAQGVEMMTLLLSLTWNKVCKNFIPKVITSFDTFFGNFLIGKSQSSVFFYFPSLSCTHPYYVEFSLELQFVVH